METIVLTILTSCLNIPYVWGGANPMTGIDCSGLALWWLKSVGLWDGPDDTTAQGIHDHYKKSGSSDLSIEDTHIGCLLFFGTHDGNISHIATAIGGGLMIEAGGGGSQCKTPSDAAKLGACVRVRPIRSRRDLQVILSPL